MEGTVVRVDSGSCLVSTPVGVRRCSLRGRLARHRSTLLRLVAVGDRVSVEPGTGDQAVIREILPRRTRLSRRATGGSDREQVVVANVDQVLLVTSFAKPIPNFELVDRGLVAAAAGGLAAVICANKNDLAHMADGKTEVALQTYEALGLAVVRTSALKGIGVDTLRERLHRQVTVLAGASGVGKTTLLNAVQPGLELRTAPVSRKTGEGRHTTTAVQLLPLAENTGYVIDTPGMRAYTLWDIDPAELDRHFPEIDSRRDDCRFANCTHSHEPDCAVKSAVDRGDIDTRRHKSYLKLLRELS